jgi:hypothetical protein
MHCIGHYYSPDGGIYPLFRADYMLDTWVSNICYYHTDRAQYYSPMLSNIAYNSRDHDGQYHDELWWGRYITHTHPSFVYHR